MVFKVFRTQCLKVTVVHDHTLMRYMGFSPHFPYKGHIGMLLIGQFIQNTFPRSIAQLFFSGASQSAALVMNQRIVYTDSGTGKNPGSLHIGTPFLRCKMPPSNLLCNAMYWAQKMAYPLRNNSNHKCALVLTPNSTFVGAWRFHMDYSQVQNLPWSMSRRKPHIIS